MQRWRSTEEFDEFCRDLGYQMPKGMKLAAINDIVVTAMSRKEFYRVEVLPECLSKGDSSHYRVLASSPDDAAMIAFALDGGICDYCPESAEALLQTALQYCRVARDDGSIDDTQDNRSYSDIARDGRHD